ncbi:MAG: hypothetical protein HUK14_09000 [Muribaculaceae bacterium]|nr:hypothetical protein [Muribaculaceae bacterium]
MQNYEKLPVCANKFFPCRLDAAAPPNLPENGDYPQRPERKKFPDGESPTREFDYHLSILIH